jgi:hypothetical protein
VRAPKRLAAVPAVLLLLAACNGEAPEPEPEATDVPEELAGAGPIVGEGGIGTPMEERVAVLGVLNKRNNLSRDLEMKPGEARRVFDNVVVRLSACERTAPWEEPPEVGAFVQVIVFERGGADSDPDWRRRFSGWLFKNSPSLNVVEHPIYDVWVKDCRMSFPGEEAPAAADEGADESPAPAPRAAPRPSPTPTPETPAAPSNET